MAQTLLASLVLRPQHLILEKCNTLEAMYVPTVAVVVAVGALLLSAAAASPAFHFYRPGEWLGSPAAALWPKSGESGHVFLLNADGAAPPAPTPGASWLHLSTEDMVHWALASPSTALAAPAGVGAVVEPVADLAHGAAGVDVGASPAAAALVGGNGSSVAAAAAPADLSTFSVIQGGGIRPPAGVPVANGPSCWLGADGVAYAAVAGGASVLLYNSTNPSDGAWQHQGTLFTPTPAPPAPIDSVEYFSLGPLSSNYALLFTSSNGTAAYQLGAGGSDGTAFAPSAGASGVVDHGDVVRGLRAAALPDGRNVAFVVLGEALGARGARLHGSNGFDGVLGLPREVVSGPSSTLLFRPVQEVTLLRQQHLNLGSVYIPVNASYALTGVASFGARMELRLSVQLGAAFGAYGAVGLRVLKSPDAAQPEFTSIELASVAPAKPCSAQPMYSHTDSLANDIVGYVLPSANVSLCQAACCARNDCTAWTYTDPQPEGDAAGSKPVAGGSVEPCTSGKVCCWLKSGAAHMLPAGGCPTCTSGFGTSLGDFSLNVQRLHSGSGAKSTLSAPLANLDPSQPIDLRVFVDDGVVEVFVNGGAAALSTRVYPTQAESCGVELFTANGNATVQVDAWEMKSIA